MTHPDSCENHHEEHGSSKVGIHEHHHGFHKHSHSHAPKNFNTAFAVGIGLNLAFVIVEAAYGVAADSMALLADAGHNLSDVLGLALAWVAMRFAKTSPNQIFTYGLRRGTILSAFLNGIFLMVAVGAVSWEALGRLLHPEPIHTKTMMAVAAVGILINGGTALLFVRSQKHDLNLRGAYLHMASDALISAGVVLTGALIHFTQWYQLDAAVSLGIGLVIIWGSWGLLRDSAKLALDAVPTSLKFAEVEIFLRTLPAVEELHHLHIWALSTSETALTCHLVVSELTERENVLEQALTGLKTRYKISHATLQLEAKRMYACGEEKCGDYSTI